MYQYVIENLKPLFRARFRANWLTECGVPYKMWRKGDTYYIRTYPDEYKVGTVYKYNGKNTFWKRADFYKENWKLCKNLI